jgi:flagellar hook-basal body complex protein FliE
MSQGIEFNRLMLDMRAMQMDAMSAPKSSAAVPELVAAAFPTCSVRPSTK